MEQENIELKVWKDLAVSKQVLMRTASDALGLAPDCNADELRVALDEAIKRGNNAEATVKAAQEEAKAQITEIERKLKDTEKALAEALGKIDGAEQGRKDAEHRVEAAREANAKEIKRANDQLAEKQRLIKSIHTSLADTPENVVKKLKKLKKEKLDEANARKRVETEVRTLKKDKKSLEESLEDNKTRIEKTGKLVDLYRELYSFCQEQREQMLELGDKSAELPELPTFDEHLLESLEDEDKSKQEKSKAA